VQQQPEHAAALHHDHPRVATDDGGDDHDHVGAHDDVHDGCGLVGLQPHPGLGRPVTGGGRDHHGGDHGHQHGYVDVHG
jgi:hypothetical protein